MPLTRTGSPNVRFNERDVQFIMMNGTIPITFSIGWSLMKDMEKRDAHWRQTGEQFLRLRDRIEDVAQYVFFSRQPHTNDPVVLTREHLFP